MQRVRLVSVFWTLRNMSRPLSSASMKRKTGQEDSLLSYILDPQGYAAKEATDYMEGNQEEMLFDFLCNDVELAEYQALVEDTDNPVHIVKKIMAAMNTTPAKTVNVTICRMARNFPSRRRRRSCAAIVRTITALGIS